MSWGSDGTCCRGALKLQPGGWDPQGPRTGQCYSHDGHWASPFGGLPFQHDMVFAGG